MINLLTPSMTEFRKNSSLTGKSKKNSLVRNEETNHTKPLFDSSKPLEDFVMSQ